MEENKKLDKIHVVSFSGGKDSTAMLLHMIELKMHIDIVLYCDTYMEFPAMVKHIEKIKKVVENAGVKFVTLKNPLSFKYLMLEHQPKRRTIKDNVKGYSWAGSRSRWCTSKLKTDIIDKYKKELSKHYEIVEYVGIAYDEQYRLEREQNKKHIHPLIDWKWDEATCLEYCYNKGYDWDGLYKIFHRVSCWCCPLQSLDELRKLRKYFPDLWEELRDMDNKTWRKFRKDFSVEELEKRFQLEEEMLKEGKDINPHKKEFREELKKRLK